MANKAIKYRIYPTTEQSIMFSKTFGCCRKVYNLMLSDKIEGYKAMHSAIDRFFGSKEYLPATKYLDLYLIMFWWLQKQKDLNSNELVTRLFNSITGHVSSETRANMHRITIATLVTRKLPIDTKGYF